MAEDTDWELRWPPTLLRSEGHLLRDPRESDWLQRIEFLLESAFVGVEARDAFRRQSGPVDKSEFVEHVVADADRFPRASDPRPYWPQRQAGARPSRLTGAEVRARFIRLIEEFYADGYLAQAFPKVCVDDRAGVWLDPSEVLQDRLGSPKLWPLRDSQALWDDDTFYGLVEVLHDLVARPWSRSWHDWDECGWHWSDFARKAGQTLYRWRVNQLFDRSELDLRLADDGEDIGRLVAVTDDERAGLAARMAARTDVATGDPVRHALSLFRTRGSTAEDKRSAIVTLAGILEQRRSLIKAELFRKDEGALFQLANEFSLRHRNEAQKDDYDPAFLDWVFWWYLATVELADRLHARQQLAGSS